VPISSGGVPAELRTLTKKQFWNEETVPRISRIEIFKRGTSQGETLTAQKSPLQKKLDEGIYDIEASPPRQPIARAPNLFFARRSLTGFLKRGLHSSGSGAAELSPQKLRPVRSVISFSDFPGGCRSCRFSESRITTRSNRSSDSPDTSKTNIGITLQRS
jgi:hypothetical protein